MSLHVLSADSLLVIKSSNIADLNNTSFMSGGTEMQLVFFYDSEWENVT